jgi:hypothetical protein
MSRKHLHSHSISRAVPLFVALLASSSCTGSTQDAQESDDTDSGGTFQGAPTGGESPVLGSGGSDSGGAGLGSGGVESATGGAETAGGGNTGGGASGGAVGFSTDRSDFGLGLPSRCPGSFVFCENFETTNVGSIPSSLSLTGYGDRTVGVTESQSARGGRSAQIDIAGSQGAVVAMLSLNDLQTLEDHHFGRMFYRILGPGVSEFVHFDVVEAVGPWMTHQNAVRFASTGTNAGTSTGNWSWIYNVQPFGAGAGAEFGSEGDRSVHPVVDEWMCLEWEYDSSAQTATYYHDGVIIDYLVIDTERSEIPVFTEIKVGLQKFQNTGAFRVWLDEVALHTSRIGCNF